MLESHAALPGSQQPTVRSVEEMYQPTHDAPAIPAATVLELRVRNHPGTMSHVTGLFARRAFNLEAIACAPVGNVSESTMLLLVANEPRLEQVQRQLEKLHDVISVRLRADILPDYFSRFVTSAGK